VEGDTDILNVNPDNNRMKANNCMELPFKCCRMISKSREPVAPYISDIPNSNKPEEKADDIMNLKAASDDCLLARSKLAIAAKGIVDNSSPTKKINKFPLEIMKNIPNKVHSMRT
jgi:hypothetical protein